MKRPGLVLLSLLCCGCPFIRDAHVEDLEDWDDDGYVDVLYGGEDCDDTDPSVNPEAEEVYYDGVDQDCDGASDYDADGDGFDAESWDGEDCDDGDAEVHPLADDPADDGEDWDCDGWD